MNLCVPASPRETKRIGAWYAPYKMEGIVCRKERKKTQEPCEVRRSPSFAFCVSFGCDPIRAIRTVEGVKPTQFTFWVTREFR
jgi:hypothetical protein